MSNKGGYDYEFVTPPPKSLECSICLLALRDPHVISCCGNEFCQACIERVRRDGKPCPLCNEHSELHHTVTQEAGSWSERPTSDPLSTEGTGLWVGGRTGAASAISNYINPGAGVSSAQGCEFLTVECAYRCGAQLQQRLIQEHEMDACPKQPIEMQVASLRYH